MELMNWLTNEYNEGRLNMDPLEFNQLIETLIDLNNTRTYLQYDADAVNGGK